MNTALQTYQFHTHALRIITDENGSPWFLAKDICEILGYQNVAQAITDNCRKEGTSTRYIPELSNNYKIIDEGNLYRLIIKSTKPESLPFESWVCDEVLPTLRKTGSYQVKPDHSLSADRLQNQLEALQRHALRANPLWKKIVAYKKMGLTHVEIGKIVGRHVSTVRKYVRQLEACGLVPYAKQLAVRGG